MSNSLIKDAVETSINLLFSENELTPFQVRQLKSYIKKSHEENQACVLYALSERFKNFLNEIGINPAVLGKQEVIIYQNFTVGYTENYLYRPKDINLDLM